MSAYVPDPLHEAARLRALDALNLIGAPPGQEFESLVAVTARMLAVPIALVTLIDQDRQWMHARQGLAIPDCHRDIAFCNHTIRGTAPLVVPDATVDPRFAVNPLVTGEEKICFYAGIPIRAPDPLTGEQVIVGALCVLDRQQRVPDDTAMMALAQLATLAETLLDARSTAQRALRAAAVIEAQSQLLRRKDRTFGQVERMALIGSWRVVLADESVEWSDGVHHIHETDPNSGTRLVDALDYYPPHARADVSAALAHALDSCTGFDIETDFITATGRSRRVRSIGEVEMADGEPVAVVGVFQDITDQYLAKQALQQLASVDVVTHLANRAAFNRAIEAAMASADREPFALVMIDLDGFKHVNDTYGHLIGDDVLRATGERLGASMLRGSFAARLGGDEFALIISDPDLVAQIDSVVAQVGDSLRVPVHTTAGAIIASGTIGYDIVSRPGSIRDFVHQVDSALYIAKRNRRGSARRAEPIPSDTRKRA